MRLLNTKTQRLETFVGGPIPRYAILSHTWGEEEILYEDMRHGASGLRDREGYRKIHYTCTQAQEDRVEYAWIDSCCIDKGSSAELSEAINSMYAWYRAAVVCYVYLSDLPATCPRLVERYATRKEQLFKEPTRVFGDRCVVRARQHVFDPSKAQVVAGSEASQLYSCRWFIRGWTLQELIAPQQMMFFGSAWNFVGFRDELLHTVSDITRIDIPVLQHKCDVSQVSIAKRMSWAARRQTTRPEDRAYCLLGIFGVNMALLYGEGNKAFRRLQEELLKVSSDHTIFVWNNLSNRPLVHADTLEPDLLLATSPDKFSGFSNVSCFKGHSLSTSLEITNTGLRITLPLIRYRADNFGGSSDHFVGILNCRYEDDLTKIIGVRLRCEDSEYRKFSVTRLTLGGTNNASTRTAEVKIDEVRNAMWRSIVITSRGPDYKYNSRTKSVWIRSCPWEIHEAHPPGQWNLHSKVMNRNKCMTVGNDMQLGGLAIGVNGVMSLAICFAIVPAGSSNMVLGVRHQGKSSLKEIYERFQELLLQEEAGLRFCTLPIAACFQVEKTIEVRIQLAYEDIMGESVLVMDIGTQAKQITGG